jgi:predicted metal-dependent hydrolase
MQTNEPRPPEPPPARYTSEAFPAYRYIPGLSPHPRRDRDGHSWGRPEPRVAPMDPEACRRSRLYLRGVDLFNHAYFWESHEAFEALWRASGGGGAEPLPPTAELLQALVQTAASEIKRFLAERAAATALPGAPTAQVGGVALADRALARFARVPSPWLGLDLRALERDVRDRRDGVRLVQPVLVLSAEGPSGA